MDGVVADPVWTNDARHRALTRSVLMALARKRDWYFDVSYPSTALWAVLSLGTWPLLLQAFRFDRFRRLEWNQYHAFAQWISIASEHPIAADLETFADKAGGRPSPRWGVRFAVAWALVLAAYAFMYSGFDGLTLVQTVFYPQSMQWPALAFNAVLAIGYLILLLTIVRQQTMTSLWIGRLNELLTAHDRRPIPLNLRSISWTWLVAASLLVIVGPTWAGAMLVAVATSNRYTRSTRALRLAMLERMLEWMDTSGLPVEFDIEEIEPEELVAMA